MIEFNGLSERVGPKTAFVAAFLIGWIVFAVNNWNLARRGRIGRQDRWAGLRYGWAWPVVVVGFVVLHIRDVWKART